MSQRTFMKLSYAEADGYTLELNARYITSSQRGLVVFFLAKTTEVLNNSISLKLMFVLFMVCKVPILEHYMSRETIINNKAYCDLLKTT